MQPIEHGPEQVSRCRGAHLREVVLGGLLVVERPVPQWRVSIEPLEPVAQPPTLVRGHQVAPIRRPGQPGAPVHRPIQKQVRGSLCPEVLEPVALPDFLQERQRPRVG